MLLIIYLGNDDLIRSLVCKITKNVRNHNIATVCKIWNSWSYFSCKVYWPSSKKVNSVLFQFVSRTLLDDSFVPNWQHGSFEVGYPSRNIQFLMVCFFEVLSTSIWWWAMVSCKVIRSQYEHKINLHNLNLPTESLIVSVI